MRTSLIILFSLTVGFPLFGGAKASKSRKLLEDPSWSVVSQEKGHTVYTLSIEGVDFEFVRLDGSEDEPFFIQSHMVTQRQWMALVGGNPAFFKEKGVDCPVESVSIDDIQTKFLPKVNAAFQGLEVPGHLRLPSQRQLRTLNTQNSLKCKTSKQFVTLCNKCVMFDEPYPVNSSKTIRGKVGLVHSLGMKEFVEKVFPGDCTDYYMDRLSNIHVYNKRFLSFLDATLDSSTSNLCLCHTDVFQDVGFRLVRSFKSFIPTSESEKVERSIGFTSTVQELFKNAISRDGKV